MKISQIGKGALAVVAMVVASGLSSFGDVSGLATDSLGNVYVADNARGTIRKFDREGKQLGDIVTNITGLHGLSVVCRRDHYHQNEECDVFFTTQGPGERGGVWKATFSDTNRSVNPVVSNLSNPAGIAGDEAGNVYFTEAKFGTVMKFGSKGEWLSDFVSRLSKTEAVVRSNLDQSVYFTGDGKVWKATHQGKNNYQVEALITNGLENPNGLALDNAGQFLYVSDSAKGTISKYSTDGKLVSVVLDNAFGTRAIAADGNKLYFAVGDRVYKSDPDDKETSWFPARLISLHDSDLLGIGVDKEKNVFVTGDRSIHKFDRFGNKLPDVATGLERPWGIAIDRQGCLYFNCFGSGVGVTSLWKMAPNSSKPSGYAFADRKIQCASSGVAVSNNEEVYTTTFNNAFFYKLDASLTETELAFTDLFGITGVAVDDMDTLYFCLENRNQGGAKLWWAEHHGPDTYSVHPLGADDNGSMTGVAVDARGDVYAADITNRVVRRWNSHCQELSPLGNGMNLKPQGVAVDNEGSVYLLSTTPDDKAVWKFKVLSGVRPFA